MSLTSEIVAEYNTRKIFAVYEKMIAEGNYSQETLDVLAQFKDNVIDIVSD